MLFNPVIRSLFSLPKALKKGSLAGLISNAGAASLPGIT
jgi:hypothetical protein